MRTFEGTLSTPDGRIVGRVRGYIDSRSRTGGFDRSHLTREDVSPGGELHLNFRGGQRWPIRVEVVEDHTVQFRASDQPPR